MLNNKLTKKRSQPGGNQSRKRKNEINILKTRILDSLEKEKENIFENNKEKKSKKEKKYNTNADELCISTSEYYPKCENRKIEYLNKDIQICKYDNDKKKCSKLDYTTVLDKKKQIKSDHHSNLQKRNEQRKQAQNLTSTGVNYGNDPLTEIAKANQDKAKENQRDINSNLRRTNKIIRNARKEKVLKQKKQIQNDALQRGRIDKINKKNKKRGKRTNKLTRIQSEEARRQAQAEEARRQAQTEDEAKSTKKVKTTCKNNTDCNPNFTCSKKNEQNTDGTCVEIRTIEKNTTETSEKNTIEAAINTTTTLVETSRNTAPTITSVNASSEETAGRQATEDARKISDGDRGTVSTDAIEEEHIDGTMICPKPIKITSDRQETEENTVEHFKYYINPRNNTRTKHEINNIIQTNNSPSNNAKTKALLEELEKLSPPLTSDSELLTKIINDLEIEYKNAKDRHTNPIRKEFQDNIIDNIIQLLYNNENLKSNEIFNNLNQNQKKELVINYIIKELNQKKYFKYFTNFNSLDKDKQLKTYPKLIRESFLFEFENLVNGIIDKSIPILPDVPKHKPKPSKLPFFKGNTKKNTTVISDKKTKPNITINNKLKSIKLKRLVFQKWQKYYKIKLGKGETPLSFKNFYPRYLKYLYKKNK